MFEIALKGLLKGRLPHLLSDGSRMYFEASGVMRAWCGGVCVSRAWEGVVEAWKGLGVCVAIARHPRRRHGVVEGVERAGHARASARRQVVGAGASRGVCGRRCRRRLLPARPLILLQLVWLLLLQICRRPAPPGPQRSGAASCVWPRFREYSRAAASTRMPLVGRGVRGRRGTCVRAPLSDGAGASGRRSRRGFQ